MKLWILYLILTVQAPHRGPSYVSLPLAHKFKTERACELYGRAEVKRTANVGGFGGWEQPFATVSYSCATGILMGGVFHYGGALPVPGPNEFVGDSPGKITIDSGVGGR